RVVRARGGRQAMRARALLCERRADRRSARAARRRVAAVARAARHTARAAAHARAARNALRDDAAPAARGRRSGAPQVVAAVGAGASLDRGLRPGWPPREARASRERFGRARRVRLERGGAAARPLPRGAAGARRNRESGAARNRGLSERPSSTGSASIPDLPRLATLATRAFLLRPAPASPPDSASP